VETIGFLTRQIRSVEKAVLPKVKLRPEFEILKNGNRYLSWAYVEAANFAVRYSPPGESLSSTQVRQGQESGRHQGLGEQAGKSFILHLA